MSTVTADPSSKPRLSPRKRAQRMRWAQYAVLGIVTILAISMANWSQIQSVFFRGDMIHETLTQGLPNAFKNTIVYTLGAFVFGLVLGTMLALMRLSSVGPYRWIATTYIEFFRGLPAIVVFIAFGLLPLAFNGLVIPFDPYGTVWIALGLVGAAYMAETIRAGIQAVPKGQVEAARSLGMPTGTATRKIVLPQAFRIITPPLTNELILLVKDSSLVYILGLSAQGFELTKYGRAIANTNANLTPLVIAGFCYLLITLPLSMVVRRMEARQKKER
ncbi:MAG TPA: amino acid ABC transporter permease [Phycicoccus elongatus]|jgi:polar amino acid transport system permease protein|uniref:Putative amino acid transporter subunit: permease component of ABC superfamily transporter n=1 Tax=Phycicoccus elongatus Lp2 TaxID=1193181 RepID=N0E048_9MICO|nr:MULTISPECIES: amino acid ABC transporter permease [Phycicoccus]MBK8730572.1 amino acid ABC transporter permease [Tetrasphaera sp.]MCA0322434.1 amino acid ABC transporter permease [Actinomycetota bacterium]MCB1239878.1 amino acid ABC transporter permease [Tetrasphaera sp.]MCB9406036.1 amino acid ABC transporter permease [Tetrasphaera sp.]MCO5301930.1 amino acid ABC transporter permease [Phycicoccus sp.]